MKNSSKFFCSILTIVYGSGLQTASAMPAQGLKVNLSQSIKKIPSVENVFQSMGQSYIKPSDIAYETAPLSSGMPTQGMLPGDREFFEKIFLYKITDLPKIQKTQESTESPRMVVVKVGDEFFFQLIHEINNDIVYSHQLVRVLLVNPDTGEAPKTADDFIENRHKYKITSSRLFPGFFGRIHDFSKEHTPQSMEKLLTFFKPFLKEDGKDPRHSYNTNDAHPWNNQPSNDFENICYMMGNGDFLILTTQFMAFADSDAMGEDLDSRREAAFALFKDFPTHLLKGFQLWLKIEKALHENDSAALAPLNIAEKTATEPILYTTAEDDESRAHIDWLTDTINEALRAL